MALSLMIYFQIASDVDLDKVRLRLNSTLLAYGSPKAKTFGYVIYWRSSSFDACEDADMSLLMHKLVHVRQIEKSGETMFACIYGAGAIQNAFDLTVEDQNHGLSIASGCSTNNWVK